MAKVPLMTLVVLAAAVGSAHAQQCLHARDEAPEQAARRREALAATRAVNTLQANQPGSRARSYVRYEDLANAPYAAQMRQSSNDLFKRISLVPGTDVLPGWTLTLDVGVDGYWFMIKDEADPCGFAYISNQNGIIFQGEPIR